MDELVRHCLRELSFDGDLGCDVSRLRDFINEFYSHTSSSQVHNQTVDDAFCAFVWSVIVQQPGVRVGTIPLGGSTEVYIAPQASAIRKAKAKGEEAVEEPAPATCLDIIEDAAIRPLEDLRQQYGDQLRIAVDPETTFAALTGSHIRPSKLTPMIYTGLQIITRGRDRGVSVLDLGKKSGYDQKTCFYIIKQLSELDLVVKLRQPGVSTNLCVHKYIYDHSPIWQQVEAEKKKVAMEEQAKDGEGESDEDMDQEEMKPLAPVHFDPIDARHLSSLPVLRSRLTKLLKNCPHYMHTSNNLMLRIGFVNPTRTDRRFFRTRLRELMAQGFIEKVYVPHRDQRRFPDKKIPCIRLITDDTGSSVQGEVVPAGEDDLEDVEDDAYTGLKANVSLHRQIIDCLAEAGTKGMTLNELSAALEDFDKRTVDLLLNRLEKDPPPAHLADLGIAQLSVTDGRERHYNYYTLANYLIVAEKEQIEDDKYRDVDMSAVGGFYPVGAYAFYETDAQLVQHIGRSAGKEGAASKGKGKGKKRVNPILPDGSVKKGRPRKAAQADGEEGTASATPAKKGRKRKREETEGGGEAGSADAAGAGEGTGEPLPKKKRGRPPKNPPPETGEAGLSQATPSVPRKRGRPPKQRPEAAGAEGGDAAGPSESAAPKKRGRPRKSQAPPPAAGADSAVSIPAVSIENGETATAAIEDVPMVETGASSPLTSVHATPAPEEQTVEDPSDGHQPVAAVSDESNALPAPAEALQPPPSVEGLRRSTRRPKVRQRGDSLSPTRQSARRTRASTSAVQSTETLVSAADHGDASSSVDKMAMDESIVAPVGLLSPSSDDLMPPPPLPFRTDATQANIPIDPALLQSDDLSSILSQGHSLIAMTPDPEAGPSTMVDSKKRDQPETPSAEPIAKRTKSNQAESSKQRLKGNLSQPRREKEIVRLLEEAGGIMHTSTKDFYDAHAALVERLSKAGEPTSTRPGAKIDKRTLEATISTLVDKGKIKLVTTAVPTLTQTIRQFRVIYLPDVSPDALQEFLTNLGQSVQTFPPPISASAKMLDEPIAYAGGKKKVPAGRGRRRGRPSGSAQQQHTDEEPQELKIMDMATLFQQEDSVIRDAMLSEKNTVAQLYGYIVGKAARARALHMLTIELFEQGVASPQVVSHQHRIVHISHYFTDIPITAYCALVAVLQPDEKLGQLIHSPQGGDTLVRSMPESVRAALAPAQSKSRARILSLLDMLRVLGLVTPLVPSESENPTFTCDPNSQHPTAYDIAPPGPYTPAVAPIYWRFNDIVPVHLWALGQGIPSVWKMAPVLTSEQAAVFWDELERVSTDVSYAQEILGGAPPSAGEASEEIIQTYKTLRRPVAWCSVYNLSLLQTEYLRRFVDPSTGNTPLEDGDRGAELLYRLAWVVSASPEVVTHWLEKARKKHQRDLQKKLAENSKGKKKAGLDKEAGAVLARRAAEAKEQRERDWNEMVARVHHGELRDSAAQRVHRLKTKFMQGSGKASEKWETRILDAIQEADLVADKLLSTARPPLFPPVLAAKPALPIPVTSSVQEKDVDELIASQGPRVPKDARTTTRTKKGKGKDTGDGEVKTPRRHRFLWTRDYDELARDASVIIKARCRGPTRLDWGAMEQVFPAVPRNSVRQRLVHLREVPGTETYLSRLEDKWYDLWVQHRGTDELPDPDPASATNFDLAAHVKFLRKHIDKNAIRVGFVEVKDIQKVDLPASIEDIEQYYDVVEKVPNAPAWDFMWTVVAEEAREKQFAHCAFTADVGDMPPSASYDSDSLQVADTAVKMALGNPNETYDADIASEFLKGVGEESVRHTTTELLNRGVLAKLVRDPTKSKPGRSLKISDSNQNVMGGQLPRELFQDAAALDELIAQQQQQHGQEEEWQEWSLLATDGDTAFLLELASENKVRFDVDTSHPKSMRKRIDWNSKKADDDDIETSIRVCYRPSGLREASVPEPSIEPSGMSGGTEMDVDESQVPGHEHSQTADGEVAFCRRTSEGIVDCHACLEWAKSSLLRDLSDDESSAVEKLLPVLDEAGSKGLTKRQLLAKLAPFQIPEGTLSSVVQHMSEAPVPLAHWTGYAAIVLVSAKAIRPWSVTVSDAQNSDRKSLIFPRRWLDIFGRKLEVVWEAAMRSALGLVLLRPGISQVEIRWRLRTVYDRQEVCEVLQTLQEEGYITPRIDAVHRTFDGGPADESEEKFTFWFLASNGRRWYQV
ncbi:hypothetical protein L227DRAFT_544094 [Lentinus tigrinus ALCF2SS1-6]|uniref:Transcription factor tau subunit sfc3/Tfc3 C-terminal domain-containing protein n=1 Tax=Lentinus tigrinus ALCF2SS1-6 TaxID=1328759 RepID=A0A5C2SHJ4_9APHY|nr:hypothetical protein L227DRAFT_544094 [Lentinus tigrinus ALCF2SS1-6]